MPNNNETRAVRADDTLAFYVRQLLNETYNRNSKDENLVDLLTDLMHFAASDDIDFELNLRMAMNNFAAEQQEKHGNCKTCHLLGKECHPNEEDYSKPCSEYMPVCPGCDEILELQRTEVILGVCREVYSCIDCELLYVKDVTDPSGVIEYAVQCIICHHLWPLSSSHLIHESTGFSNYIGACCWDDRLRHCE